MSRDSDPHALGCAQPIPVQCGDLLATISARLFRCGPMPPQRSDGTQSADARSCSGARPTPSRAIANETLRDVWIGKVDRHHKRMFGHMPRRRRHDVSHRFKRFGINTQGNFCAPEVPRHPDFERQYRGTAIAQHQMMDVIPPLPIDGQRDVVLAYARARGGRAGEHVSYHPAPTKEFTHGRENKSETRTNIDFRT